MRSRRSAAEKLTCRSAASAYDGFALTISVTASRWMSVDNRSPKTSNARTATPGSAMKSDRMRAASCAMSGSEMRSGTACASMSQCWRRPVPWHGARGAARRQAVSFGDDGDGLVTAPWRGQDASDQLVELIVVEQMGLLGHLGKWHDVFRNLEKQGKDLVPVHEGRIGLREQLQQGRQVLFLDSLLLAIVRAPGSAGRRRLSLRRQLHLERARNAVANCGVADPLEHAILNRALLDKPDFRCAGQCGLLLQYRACGTLEGLGKVLVVAAGSDVGLGIAVLELE